MIDPAPGPRIDTLVTDALIQTLAGEPSQILEVGGGRAYGSRVGGDPPTLAVSYRVTVVCEPGAVKAAG